MEMPAGTGRHSRRKKRLLSAEGAVLLVLLILVTAFYHIPRCTFHTDTGIYHAQAIRM
jgi:hypothetical protein